MDIPDIVARLDDRTARRIYNGPHPTNRASEAGHPCERYLVLARLHPEMKALHDLGLQRIFDEGRLHETALLRELEEAGFELAEQQRAFTWPKFQLTGHVDAMIGVNGAGLPLEIKSVSPHLFESVKAMAPADFLEARQVWLRKYPAQVLLYCLMAGKDTGLMLLKNKSTGEKCLKVFRLYEDGFLEYTEGILKKLERVNAWVEKGEAPPPTPCDECRGCGFEKTVCFPGRDYGPGYDLLADPELTEQLERWAELRPVAQEYEALDKSIKEKVKGRSAIIGDFIIESQERSRRGYEIPADLKKQYEKVTTYYVTKIERVS